MAKQVNQGHVAAMVLAEINASFADSIQRNPTGTAELFRDKAFNSAVVRAATAIAKAYTEGRIRETVDVTKQLTAEPYLMQAFTQHEIMATGVGQTIKSSLDEVS